MIITKQTPLQANEIELLAKAKNIDLAAKQLKLGSRPGVPLEIVRAYETLKNPQDLAAWGQDSRNWALHRLAVQANRGSWIGKQASDWGTQYSALVNMWLLANPNYREPKRIKQLQPLFNPKLYQAIQNIDQDNLPDLPTRQQLRQALITKRNKSAHQISNPTISNHYNLEPLNWVVLLELWVCVPNLQHPNQLLEFLAHRSLGPQPLFADNHIYEIPRDI